MAYLIDFRKRLFWLAAFSLTAPLSAVAITEADIDNELNSIAIEYSEGDQAREQLERVYSGARNWLRSAVRHEASANENAALIVDGPEQIRTLRGALDKSLQSAEEPFDAGEAASLPFDELEQVAQTVESEAVVLKDKASTLDNQLRILADEPARLRSERDVVVERVAELEREFNRVLPDEAGPLQIAERTSLQAELLSRRAELRRIEQALLTTTVRSDITIIENDLARAKLKRLTARSVEISDLLSAARRKTANSVLESTKQAQYVAADSHPLVQRAVDENAKYGEELSEIIAKQSRVAEAQRGLELERVDLEREFARSQERLKYAGYGSGLGHLLIDQRRRIPRVRGLEQQSTKRKQTVAEIGLRSIEIDDQLNELDDITVEVDRLVEEYNVKSHQRQDLESMRAQLDEGLHNRQSLLRLLAKHYSKYLRAIGDTEFETQQLISVANAYGNYLDKKITWIPNASALGVGMLIDALRGIKWFSAPKRWRSLADEVRKGIQAIPGVVVICLLALMAVFGISRSLNAKLVDLGVKVRNVRTDKFRYTLAATAASLVTSTPWAIAMWLASSVLRSAPNSSDFALALGHSFSDLVPIVFVFHWFRRLLRKDGIGRLHFHWRDSIAAGVRRATTQVMLVFIPAYWFAMFFEHLGNAPYQYGSGRVAFLIAMGAVSVYLFRLGRPHGFVVNHLKTRYPSALITRAHAPIGWIAMLMPACFAILAAVGFYYTALNLNRYLLQTGLLILLAIVLRGLTIRWLMLAESRLALRRARERRDAMIEAAKDNGETPEVSPDDIPIDMPTINAQTRVMLSNVIGWSFAVGLYLIWQAALPAFGILESVHLWEIEVPGIDGVEVQAISLATLLVAAIVVVVTVVAAKNLPGVLEIGLLQRLPLQAGSRYAITTLSQYLITAVGITIAFSALGARWSQIQWLVAALSVGLGFGLQEIVANFISGIILLFERPIRVGDTVTIGELTGKVARIRIRATTIIDWDNREIVVPNKNFITERFVNWTLSDPVNRLKIRIGIAYGSDVSKALELMHAAASKQDKVLSDPAPRVYFLGFGDSSLDFEVQTYIRDLNDRLPVIHDLHIAINEAFAAADIEIPFPQRDLHIRSQVAHDEQ